MTDFHWKAHTQSVVIRNADGTPPPPRCFKQYRRNGKLFWRNYRRDVPGGVTFIGWMSQASERARDDLHRRMEESLFG